MKTTVLPRALYLVLVGATIAGAQVTTVSGRVTTEAGVGIGNVYVGAIGAVLERKPDGEAIVERAETLTSANGAYTLKIPFKRENGRYHEVRFRADGYEPQTVTVLVGSTVAENVRLKLDTYEGMTRVYGKVTTEAGAGIDSAQVYINDLNLMVRTNAAGEFAFETPASNRQVNLRVRAFGYFPGVQTIRLVGGRNEINYKLKGDPNGPRDELPVSATKSIGTTTKTTTGTATKMPAVAQGTEPARVQNVVTSAPSIARRLTETRAQQENAIQADPFNRYLFQPELVMRYQDALSLTEDQRAKLQAAMEDSQKRAVQVQWALALENEKLQKTLDKNTLDETEVVAQMDRIVGIEREMKRAQLMMLVKVKNTLTAEQQERLRRFRGYDD